MKRIAVLGSTGSVGSNALRIIEERPEHFSVACLSAHRSAAALHEQCETFRPDAACLTGVEVPAQLPCPAYAGRQGLLETLDATRPDLVLNAITGAAGLPASEWALQQGIPLALANKESLVMAGPYLMQLARAKDTAILPVDSEHCAIFQCLQHEDRSKLRRIHLTGSGGPFRTLPLEDFASVRPEDALAHPTWDMGPRITVGSATMMNKAFEVLEAHWLFGLQADEIQVVLHPQSVIHSMVEFCDGSMLAQMGLPDMRVPILFCLAWPERLDFDFVPFDLARCARLDFEAPDPRRYPALELAYEVLRRGGTSGAVLNAADEVLTEAFLGGTIGFSEISRGVAEVLAAHQPQSIHSLDAVYAADEEARAAARELLPR